MTTRAARAPRPARSRSAPRPRARARGPTIAILGLGKAGGALLASARASDVEVVAQGARLAALARTSAWTRADVLFLAVPDDVIDTIARALARKRALPALVVHMSGAKGSSALAVLGQRVVVGTFHPLAALDGVHAIPRHTFVAVDATAARARVMLSSLARRMGLTPGAVADVDRVRYHAGAVIAGNLATALLHEGVGLLVRSGVPPDVARKSLARLLLSTANNAIARELPLALTGPVARGDVATLERHVALLEKEDTALAELYRTLTRVLIDDVSARSPSSKRRLRAALDR